MALQDYMCMIDRWWRKSNNWIYKLYPTFSYIEQYIYINLHFGLPIYINVCDKYESTR